MTTKKQAELEKEANEILRAAKAAGKFNANDAAPEQDLAAEPIDAAPDETPDPLLVLEAEKADLKDRLLRALAEQENLRRRAERDISDARSYAVTGFARDLLSVADNLRRALESISPEMREAADDASKAMFEGVELTERELLKTFEKNGIKKHDPMGEKFDPHKDQAMFEVPDATKPNGSVIQVIQAGYLLNERVLRPAMVGVAKGGEK